MNTYVILAAGAGKRLWPLTESYPKPLVRVLGKSLLEWLIEGLAPTASEIMVIVGVGKEQVIQHLRGKPYSSKLVFAEQTEPKGSGHALLQAESHVKGSFIILNGDNFYDPAAFPLVAAAAKKGPFAFAYPVPDIRQYGAFQVENGLLKGVAEKSPQAKPGLANLNLFHMPQEFFELLHSLKPSPRGELEVTDALQQFAQENDVPVHELTSYWTDVGGFWNYLDANAYAAEHMVKHELLGTVEDEASVHGPVYVAADAVVKKGSRLEGPVWVGPKCVVGPNAIVRNGSVLEYDCFVGPSEVNGSVMLRGSRAPHFNYVGDSVLGENSNLGAGAKLANFSLDGKAIRVLVNGKEIDTGRSKLGACVGAGAKVGANASLMPGVLVGSKATIWPGAVVKENVPSGGEFKA